DPSFMEEKLSPYKCDGNEAIHFKLVRTASDVTNDNTTFHPEMTHQIFGDSEAIFGYKDLKVEVYYSAARLNTYVNMHFSDKVSPQKFDGVLADDVIKQVADHMPPGFHSNLDEFIALLHKDASFKPFGELKHSYTVTKDGNVRQFEIYQTGIDTPGFREYHERLQTFLLYYVDAASFIDVDDDRWQFFLCFEKYKSNGNPMYAVAGYMTVYNYYAYPDSIRPRVSQMLVLPPFQRQGHGSQMLQTFYNGCYNRNDIRDITVEDPSENFQKMRDFVDAGNCMKLKEFQPERLLEGFSDDMEWAARHKLKINKRQARQVYEILRLKATDMNNPEQAKAYRIDIKKRLNIPFQKNGKDFNKISKTLSDDELSATLQIPKEQRLAYLENTYKEITDSYLKIIEKLAIS
ncbi:unnamed protein product, partial [Owenia fusiformis]